VNRLVRALIVVPAAVVLIMAGTATVAAAVDGTPSGAPPAEGTGVWCVSTTGAKACFAEYGDRVWVKDTVKNGDPVAATIKDNEPDANWYRECFNRRGVDGGWVMCDFDVPEYQKGELWVVNNPWIGSQASTTIWTTI